MKGLGIVVFHIGLWVNASFSRLQHSVCSVPLTSALSGTGWIGLCPPYCPELPAVYTLSMAKPFGCDVTQKIFNYAHRCPAGSDDNDSVQYSQIVGVPPT
jgi:hypothetical protein